MELSALIELLNTNGGIFAVLAVVILTGLRIFDKESSELRKQRQEEENALMKALQQRIDELLEWKKSAEKQIATMEDKMTKLEGENEVLKETLQGKDKDALQFRKEGRKAMKKIDNLYRLFEEHQKKLCDHFEKIESINQKRLEVERASK